MTTRPVLLLVALLVLSACDGGGTAIGPSAPSVSGDMLAPVANRGWNYQTINASPALTLSIYADPPVGGSSVHTFTGAGVTGLVPTVLTSVGTVDSDLVVSFGVSEDVANDATIVSEISTGNTAPVPVSPFLGSNSLAVPGTLTLDQTWSPFPGATATVVAVGAMPHVAACPIQASGAQVHYTFPGYDDTVSYVPGCGITDWLNNTNHEEIALISVGSYPTLGTLATKLHRLSWIDTTLVALGLKHSPYKSLPGLGGLL